jgi:hypothetical protein
MDDQTTSGIERAGFGAVRELSLLPPGGPPASGSSLHALTTRRDAYLDLRW